MSLAYVNGEYVEASEAKIDALDRGHIFGDGLYEVISFKNGKLYQVDEHLERYRQGAKEMLFENHPTPWQLKEICQNLLDKSDIEKGIIYLQVTRGTAPRTHAFPKPADPNLFMFIQHMDDPEEEIKKNGISVTLVPDERWDRCYVKSLNLLPNCFYKEKARREGFFEAIQVSESKVTEGTSSNVFRIKDGVICTAPTGSRVLSGITRNTVVKLAIEEGIKVVEKFITVEELFDSDELFITSTVINVLPVKQVDTEKFPVSNYKTTFLLQQKLDEHKNRECS